MGVTIRGVAQWLVTYGAGKLSLDAALRRVLRLELSRAGHELLLALTGGVSLGETLAAAGAKQKSARRQDRIFRCFRTWIAEGLFTGVEIDSHSA